MSPASLIIVGFLLALVAMSFAFAGGAVVVVLPVALAGIAIVGFLDYRRRNQQAQSVRHFREEAKAEEVEFTERDKETLSSE
jgi:UDP-N-acetylmuramyl pentapeptide phosphotransferase/UDP-N-acetylglucosamine-1-phosphate transferase